jgi:hypothetical protein
MRPSSLPNPLCFAAAVGVLFAVAVPVHADPPGCLTLHRLQRMSGCELEALYTAAEVGRPPVGTGHGRIVHLSGGACPRLRLRLSNALWKGKEVGADGCFVNRWAGGVRAIGSRYVIGPSWLDGRPAMLVEYPPGTPLLWNMHDEMREVAPGLYLGPVYDRFPCPRFRGFLAVQTNPCAAGTSCPN